MVLFSIDPAYIGSVLAYHFVLRKARLPLDREGAPFCTYAKSVYSAVGLWVTR